MDGGAAQASRPLAKPVRVKNKQPAQQQITAEQILRESKEQQGVDPKIPKTKITDQDELDEYRCVSLPLTVLVSAPSLTFPRACFPGCSLLQAQKA